MIKLDIATIGWLVANHSVNNEQRESWHRIKKALEEYCQLLADNKSKLSEKTSVKCSNFEVVDNNGTFGCSNCHHCH